jgi:uncharacterized protein (DUF1330 family)
MIERICLVCKRIFYTDKTQIRIYGGKFCSQKCFHKSQIGKKRSKKVRKNIAFGKIGSKNPNWIGGKVLDKRGYILIKFREHPNAQTNGYIYEHRLVMEKHLGRYLKPEETIHHLNGDKTDNRIENLKLFASKSEHIKHIHIKIECPFCHKVFERM